VRGGRWLANVVGQCNGQVQAEAGPTYGRSVVTPDAQCGTDQRVVCRRSAQRHDDRKNRMRRPNLVTSENVIVPRWSGQRGGSAWCWVAGFFVPRHPDGPGSERIVRTVPLVGGVLMLIVRPGWLAVSDIAVDDRDGNFGRGLAMARQIVGWGCAGKPRRDRVHLWPA